MIESESQRDRGEKKEERRVGENKSNSLQDCWCQTCLFLFHGRPPM